MVLRVSHNDNPLAPDKIEIKKEMLSKNQLMISDFYNIFIGNAKTLAPNVFDKKQVFALLWELSNLLETRTKTKNNTSITITEAICQIAHTEINRCREVVTRMENQGTTQYMVKLWKMLETELV